MTSLISIATEAAYTEARALGMVKPPYLNADSDVKDQWEMIITAAMSAMKSATPDMISAARVATYDVMADEGYQRCWQAMVEEALEGEKV